MAMNFPNSPAVGDSFFWKSNTYIWDGVKWTARSAVPQVLSDGFIGAVMWFNGSRATLPNGYIAADGQLIPREDEPELFAAVEAGTFSTVDDTHWMDATLFDPNYHVGQLRGNYTLGDTVLDFRVPDLNGALTDTPVGNFLRGDANGRYPGIGAVGETLFNGAPNIQGSFVSMTLNADADAATGALYKSGHDNGVSTSTLTGGVDIADTIGFNASRSNPAYASKQADGVTPTTEVRPNSVTGIWIIRAKNIYLGGGEGTGSNSYVSETAPAGAPEGSTWYCTANGLTYIRLNDGDSVQWVESNPTAPNLGEITPESIGALPITGGTVEGALTVTAGGFTVVAPDSPESVYTNSNSISFTSADTGVSSAGVRWIDDAGGGVLQLVHQGTGEYINLYPNQVAISGFLKCESEIQNVSMNGFRLVGNAESPSMFWHHNKTNRAYMMLTNVGDEYGSFNDLRPFIVDLMTGVVTIDTALAAKGLDGSPILSELEVDAKVDTLMETINTLMARIEVLEASNGN